MSSGSSDWKSRQAVANLVDHRDRGSIGALGDRNIDGTLAVNQGITRQDVGGIRNGANIAQINRRPEPGAQRYIQQVADLVDGGIVVTSVW